VEINKLSKHKIRKVKKEDVELTLNNDEGKS
jgi:hypothetical protein